MTRATRFLPALALLASGIFAQTVTIPNGTGTAEGNAANALPWSRGAGGLTLQTAYDSSHFTAQGLANPILITGLRWRLDATQARTFAGCSYQNVTIRLSTCPVDHQVLGPDFAQNRGADQQVVFAGTVTAIAGSSTTPGPGPYLVSLTLQNPFYYRPSSGDLLVDVELPATGFTGATTQWDARTNAPNASRVYATTAGATTGTVETNHGLVMQVGYSAVTGLRAGFLANVTGGTTPLTVQFTDTSFSTAAGGITGWAWDFDNDGNVDSTQQHPTHTFTGCGIYDVRLTVTDGSNPANSLLRQGFIATDAVTPSFTTSLVGPNGTVQFTDTSVPTPTAWAWDFDGDLIVDSTLQNPQYSYGVACGAAHPVTLTVQRLCRGPFAVTRDVVAANQLATLRTGTTTLSTGCYLNLVVTRPEGIAVCALEMKTTANPAANVVFDVFLTPNGYAGATGNTALWRQIGTATATGVSGTDDLELATFSSPLYLPAGSFGLYIRTTGASPVGTAVTSTQTFSNADVSLQSGASGTLGGTATANRLWNGALRYTTNSTNFDPGCTFFAAGCAGPLGVPGLTVAALPRIGQTTSLLLERLPQSSAFVLMGFGRQMSSLGALPLDLGPFQMPGCALHVANDAALFLLGSGNTATWNLGLPLSPGLLGVQYFLQFLAPSPGTNPFGGVTSDAVAAIVGV